MSKKELESVISESHDGIVNAKDHIIYSHRKTDITLKFSPCLYG